MSKTLAVLVLSLVVARPSEAAATWVAITSTQSVPQNPVVGGWDPSITLQYICRGSYGGGVHPGRLITGNTWNGSYNATWSYCVIGYGGQEISLTSFEALTTTWQPVTGANAALPANAYAFGHDVLADGSTPSLYVCRVHDSTGTRPGKTRPGLGGCSVAESGQEIIETSYDVLIGSFPVTQIPVTTSAPRPHDVLIGGSGFTGGNLYLCAAQFGGGVHPGALDIQGVCHFGWGGGEQTVTDAQGYTALTPRWISISPGLVFATGNEADGTPLYSCRAEYPVGSHSMLAGKFERGFNGCHIGSGTEAIVTSNWTLLDNPTFLVPPK